MSVGITLLFTHEVYHLAHILLVVFFSWTSVLLRGQSIIYVDLLEVVGFNSLVLL